MSIDLENIGREAVIAIYGKVPEAPKGYEFTREFRCGRVGEFYVSSTDRSLVTGPLIFDDPPSHPRLILRRKMVRRAKHWVVTPLGRPPQDGEQYKDNDASDERLVVGERAYVNVDDENPYSGDEAVSVEPIYEEVPEVTE